MRLDELRLGCLEDRIEADLALGRHADVVAELELQIARHPLRERLRGQLMLALYRCGRQAEALATYQAYRRTLDEELGIDPSAELRALESAILAHDVGLLVARPAPATAPAAPERRARWSGRSGARASSRACTPRSRGPPAAAARVVLVTGEAGVGKTTLVETFLRATARAAVIARGQCLERHGEGEPYLPLLDALGRLARGPGGGEVVELLDAPRADVGDPDAVARSTRASSTRCTSAPAARRATGCCARCSSCSSSSPRPSPSSSCSRTCTGATRRRSNWSSRWPAARSPRACSCSPPGARARARSTRWCASCRCAGWATRSRVGPLDEAAIAQWLAERLGDAPPGLAVLLRERSGGNPLFMGHLLDHWIGEGLLPATDPDLGRLAHGLPESLRASIEDRLTRLAAAEVGLLEAASVAGGEFAVAPWPRRSSARTPRSRARLALADRRALIELRAEGGFGFTHDLHREVLYERLRRERRAALHRRIGAALERAGAPAAEVAAHFVAGHDPEPAVRFLRARRAPGVRPHRARRGHPTSCARRSSRPPTCRRGRSARAPRSSCCPRSARRRWRPAAGRRPRPRRRCCARASSPSASRTTSRWSRCCSRWRRSTRSAAQFATAGDTLGAAARLTPDGGARAPAGVARARRLQPVSPGLVRAGARGGRGRRRAVRRRAARPATTARSRRRSATTPASPATTGRRSRCGSSAARTRRSARARHAVELARDPSRAHSVVPAQAQLAIIHQCRLEPDAALAAAEATIIDASLYGYAYRVAMGRIVRGWALAALGRRRGGRVGAAGGAGGRARDRARAWTSRTTWRCSPTSTGAPSALDDGLAAVAAALEIVRRERSRFYVPELLRLRGRCSRPRGDEADAEASLKEAIDLARRLGARALELRAATSLARLWRRRGAEDRGRRLLAPALRLVQEGHETPDLRAAAALLEPAVA